MTAALRRLDGVSKVKTASVSNPIAAAMAALAMGKPIDASAAELWSLFFRVLASCALFSRALPSCRQFRLCPRPILIAAVPISAQAAVLVQGAKPPASKAPPNVRAGIASKNSP